MSDLNPAGMDSMLFQLRASGSERSLSTVESGGLSDIDSDADLKDASEQFESLLLNLMIREMRATVPDSTLFPKSMAEDIFTGMMDEQIAGEMSKSGGIGISRIIFNQLKGGN